MNNMVVITNENWIMNIYEWITFALMSIAFETVVTTAFVVTTSESNFPVAIGVDITNGFVVDTRNLWLTPIASPRVALIHLFIIKSFIMLLEWLWMTQ